jgi:thioredoxin 1
MATQEYVKHADDSNFDKVVLKANKTVLVDFWAPWCGPCRAVGPILEEIAQEYGDRLEVVKVNVDDNPDTAGKYGVRSIPTLLIISNGKVKETEIGMVPKEQLTALIDRNLNSSVAAPRLACCG